MDDCKDCEYRGYSPQVCALHVKHCDGRPRRPLPVPVKVGARTAAGVGLGMAAVLLGTAAVSLVGGAVVLHGLLFKLSVAAGAVGGGVGLFRSLQQERSNKG